MTTEVVEEYEIAPPARGPLWLQGVWFWLALLGAIVVIGLLVALLLLAVDDDEPGGTRTATIATVPDLVGLDRDEAGALLADLGYGVTVTFEPNVAPEGQVLRQEPAAGAALEVGERVLLVVSAGDEP